MTRPYIPSKANDPSTRIWYDTRPRHVAGPGDPRHVTQALRAAGWKNYSDPDFPHVLLGSPDFRYTLVLEPAPDTYSSWWRIGTQGWADRWHASFGGNTPVEVIAGFTDALLNPAPASEPDVWSPLTAAGWTYERDEQGNESAHHPDGITSMERRATLTSDYFSWSAEVALPTGGGGHRRLWQAHFDDRTPRHLLAAFATALTDPAPVPRGHYEVPHSHLVTQEPGPRGEHLAAAHEERLKAVQAAARRRAAPTMHSGPAPAAASSAAVRGR